MIEVRPHSHSYCPANTCLLVKITIVSFNIDAKIGSSVSRNFWKFPTTYLRLTLSPFHKNSLLLGTTATLMSVVPCYGNFGSHLKGISKWKI